MLDKLDRKPRWTWTRAGWTEVCLTQDFPNGGR
jgi:hypothetical protein